ncbi:MAG: cell division protein SepF [Candidatus Lokiarchaeota archaeon]|nr:cell division protein SepF [Candidatus Lokiarchaeota archaeon]
MGKFRNHKANELLGSPQEAMGFSKEYSSLLQNFIIKKYDFSDINQVEDIKKQLLGRKILLINAKEILENIEISELKRGIEDIKMFLRENGGSMGRLGDQYLILTPNNHIKIAN